MRAYAIRKPNALKRDRRFVRHLVRAARAATRERIDNADG
jgi:hypothetical protein